MKKTIGILVVVVIAALIGIGVWRPLLSLRRPLKPGIEAGVETSVPVTSASPKWGGGYQTIRAEREILVLCGTSMRPAAERLAEAFQKEQGIAVRFNYGGSSELMATIEVGPGGDLFLCHDPYSERVKEKGKLERVETVGWLTPILVVQPGNPHGIQSLADLTRPGLRVGLPDARFATAGKLVRAVLAQRGWEQAVEANLQLETRGHNELALAVSEGQLDAAVVWNFISVYYAGRVEAIPTGESFPEVRVTLCLLTTARDREAALRFLEYASSPAARAIFAEMGYRREEPAGGE